jgi:glutamate---cysteine ligase / carboxylate-amine ligase
MPIEGVHDGGPSKHAPGRDLGGRDVSDSDLVSLGSDAHPYSFGIEEEYFVVCKSTGQLSDRSSAELLSEGKLDLGATVNSEMLQSQIEIASSVLTDMDTARAELSRARKVLSRIAGRHGLGLAAAGTHPLSVWKEQRITDRDRYVKMRRELQIVGRRNVLCGMHVHVQPPPGASRIDIINRLLPYLPILLALSTSSPFWQAQRTGMKGYRLAAYDELPRTGLPPIFRNDGEYRIFINALVSSGAIPDESHIWWAMRPSARFPTIELRVTDSCTHLEDSLCLAAIFRCLVRCAVRHPELNAQVNSVTRHVVEENRWRAQRFGVGGSLIELDKMRLLPMAEIIEHLLALIRPDAMALGCVTEVEHARTILARGTSADEQIALYEKRRAKGRTRPEALRAVVDWLIKTTADVRDAGEKEDRSGDSGPAPYDGGVEEGLHQRVGRKKRRPRAR